MTLRYNLQEQDYLDFQLFTASQSERINKKKRNGWIFLTVGSFVIALLFFLEQNIMMTIYCVVVGVLCALFYPKYFIWRYKKHYQTFNKENYSQRFGQEEILEFNDDSIFSKDKTGEGKINLSEIEKIDETDNHFFMKITTGLSLIIPKNELDNIDDLRKKFKDHGWTVNDKTNWKWK